MGFLDRMLDAIEDPAVLTMRTHLDQLLADINEGTEQYDSIYEMPADVLHKYLWHGQQIVQVRAALAHRLTKLGQHRAAREMRDEMPVIEAEMDAGNQLMESYSAGAPQPYPKPPVGWTPPPPPMQVPVPMPMAPPMPTAPMQAPQQPEPSPAARAMPSASDDDLADLMGGGTGGDDEGDW
ncbi:hypothetical protein KIH27_03335 [Mycobacterium sp. M1]|uniref:Uncharacterized protein n=1 Tax=Mycolicibacter acidiphilus TaxID=2835306 RepID=A0ABS5REA2_9MYCO|nr:hypothetical protein [Mycolicibacter acidiphilus]MBS9532616.1 hypothetical protein [Mycolicibacter acidiphilus]